MISIDIHFRSFSQAPILVIAKTGFSSLPNEGIRYGGGGRVS